LNFAFRNPGIGFSMPHRYTEYTFAKPLMLFNIIGPDVWFPVPAVQKMWNGPRRPLNAWPGKKAAGLNILPSNFSDAK
jgi:hypothetical protein